MPSSISSTRPGPISMPTISRPRSPISGAVSGPSARFPPCRHPPRADPPSSSLPTSQRRSGAIMTDPDQASPEVAQAPEPAPQPAAQARDAASAEAPAQEPVQEPASTQEKPRRRPPLRIPKFLMLVALALAAMIPAYFI